MSEEQQRIVSHRNHFTQLDDFIDTYFYRCDEKTKGLLKSFGSTLLRHVQSDYATACQRAMEQTTALVLDPAYFETKKKRRAADMKRQREHQEAQVAQRLIDSADPEKVAENMERQFMSLCDRIDYHKRCLEELEAQRRSLFSDGG